MRGGLAMGPRPKCFGDQCTGDHLFSKAAVDNADPFFPLASTAVVMHDRATKWLDCYPKATKSHKHTVEAFHEWSGNKCRVKSFYCDNSHELLGAARTVGWCCPTATPGVPQTNGLAERMVRKVKEGARALLIQAGLPPKWWTYAVRAFCAAHNIKMRTGNSIYHDRHGKGHYKGLRIPFGAAVKFMPTPRPGERAGFAPVLRKGIFLGQYILTGGEWNGDYHVAEQETLREDPDVDVKPAGVHRVSEVKQILAKGFTFPIADRREALGLELAKDGVPQDPEEEEDDEDEGGDGDEILPAADPSALEEDSVAVEPASSSKKSGATLAQAGDRKWSPTHAELRESLARPDAAHPLDEYPPWERARGSKWKPEDDDPENPKWEFIAGDWVRRRAGTNRPVGVHKELWKALSVREREELIADIAKKKAAGG